MIPMRTSTSAPSASRVIVGDEPAVGNLPVAEIDLRLADPVEAADVNVANDSHHFAVVKTKIKMLADGRLARPIALDEGFADDGDVGAIGGV